MALSNKPMKRSVAVVASDDEGRILLVQRPPDDAELPGVWGLPASSLKDGETWEDAAIRCGRDKLGVAFASLSVLNEGRQERAAYTLRMKLFAAVVAPGGRPAVPQPVSGVTQYAACRWSALQDAVSALEPSAAVGSLCSELCLAFMRHGAR